MQDYVKTWVDILQKDVDDYKRRLAKESSPMMRRVYLVLIRRHERAIDVFILCTIFEAVSLRVSNLRRRIGG